MSDKFFIKHDNMILLANEMGVRLNTWISDLNEIMDGFNRFVNMEGFTGNMADRAREYCELYYGNNSMVSFPILITEAACAIKNAMVVYEKNFLDFDSIEKFSISEEELDFLAEDLRVDAVEVLEDIHNSFINIIDSVSDIITLTKPDYTKYLEDSEDIANNLETVKEKIYEIEENEKPNITELNEQLDSLIALVKSMSDKEKRVTSFVSSNEIITKELKTALEQYEKSCKNRVLNAEIIEAAYEQHSASMERLRKEQAKLRKKQGILKGIQGVFASGTGLLCIISTAGAATPVVVAGNILGGGSLLFGASDITEGGQDIYYGSIGDIDSASINPLRDSVFQGNQELYDITENYFVSGASAMVPIGKTSKAMTGAAKELTEKALISEAKQVIVDIAVSESASYGVGEYCEAKGIDGVDRMIFQAAASYLASSAVVKVNELFSSNKTFGYEIVEEGLSQDIDTDIKAGDNSHLDYQEKIVNQYYSDCNDIGKNLDLSPKEKVQAMQEKFEKLGDGNRGDVQCLASEKFLNDTQPFRDDGRANVEYPKNQGFNMKEGKNPEAISRDNPIQEMVDRYGSSGGNFVAGMENGEPALFESRALPNVENPESYHSYEVDNDRYCDAIDMVRKCDVNNMEPTINSVNDMIDTINSENPGLDLDYIDKDDMKDMLAHYGDYQYNLVNDIPKISVEDAPYGLTGEAAPWYNSAGECLSKGGADQKWLPLTVDDFEKMGIFKAVK